MNPVRRHKLKRALRKRNVRRPGLVIREAKRADLSLPDALAMLQKETGIPQKNIFGCDHGPGRAYCHQGVTRARVKGLLHSGFANGVGWTQLTYRPFVVEAQRKGGAHKPKYQMRVGFKVLADLQLQYGGWGGFRAYNGSGSAAAAYANEATQFSADWRRYIKRALR